MTEDYDARLEKALEKVADLWAENPKAALSAGLHLTVNNKPMTLCLIVAPTIREEAMDLLKKVQKTSVPYITKFISQQNGDQ